MLLTIDLLLGNPDIAKAVIDRTMQVNFDQVYWKRYLKAHESKSPTFKMAMGVYSRTVVGTMIDSYANKPLRKRKNMGMGTGEVGSFGDAFQIDNYRLDQLLLLIKKFNSLKTDADQSAMIEEIVDFLVDDWKQVYLAPMLAINKMISDARSRGKYIVSINNGEAREITLPVREFTPDLEAKSHFMTYLTELIEDLKDLGINPTAMQMTPRTFRRKFIDGTDLKGTYTMKFGSFNANETKGISKDMANQLLEAYDIPVPIELVDERLELPDGKIYKGFADDAICLLPGDNLGTCEFYKSNEWEDRVPTKTYTEAENGMVLISSQRTDEGRFLDYFMNAAPNLANPSKISIIHM